MERFEDVVLRIPSPRIPKCERLFWIDLLPGVSLRRRSVRRFLFRHDIQFAKNLFERLNPFGGETFVLPAMPVFSFQKVRRMRNPKRVGLFDGCHCSGMITQRFAFLIEITDPFDIALVDQNETAEQRSHDRMAAQSL